MACLDMYSSSSNQSSSSSSDHNNNVNKPPPLPPISPRISFSNDFAESKQYLHRHHKLNPSSSSFATPASSDFEFCVPTGINSPMIGADELFFKGRLLPLKQGTTTTTLREELMVEEGDQGGVDITRGRLSHSHRPPLKGWKELLGLRNGSKKSAAKNKAGNNNSSHHHDQELSG